VRRGVNISIWAVIVILTISTAAWVVWASRQPRTNSIWDFGAREK
jgi:hypothetical protein